MTCVVLAAGYATRLYPLTENFPKPLLDVGSKTVLDWLVDDIASTGEIYKYVVATNGKYAHHFRDWAAKAPYEIHIVDNKTTTNETRLGAVRDLELAVREANITSDLLVIAGDNLLDFSLEGYIKYAKKMNTSCILRYYEEDLRKCRKSGVVHIDAYDKVTSMQEKPQNPTSNWLAPPFYYLIASDVAKIRQAIDEGCAVDSPGGFIAWLSACSTVHAMEMPGKRYDIGDLESYERICKLFEIGKENINEMLTSRCKNHSPRNVGFKLQL